MKNLVTIQYVVMWVEVAALALLVWTLVRKGHARVFPWFFRYILFVLPTLVIGISLRSFPAPYYYWYWATEAVTILLSFLVIFEIFNHILTSGTLPVSESTFFRVNVGLLLAASVIAVFTTQVDSNAIIRALLVLISTVRIVQVGLFAILFGLSMFFGFYWNNRVFGIALGYAIFATVELSSALLRASMGKAGSGIFFIVGPTAYLCCLLVWLTYALLPEVAPNLERVPDKFQDMWSEELGRLAK